MKIDENNMMRNPQNKVKSIAHMISFLMIDFYDHYPQHTEDFAEGISKQFKKNFCFKVTVNEVFINYLTKKSIKI